MGALSYSDILDAPVLDGLPVLPHEPLAVHALAPGVSPLAFAYAWNRNALLVPHASRRVSKRARAHWAHRPPGIRDALTPDFAHGLYDRDIAAGDDRFLFLSVNHAMSRQVALAWPLADLVRGVMRRGRVRQPRIGFRPHDLEVAYTATDDWADSNDGGCGCAADDPDCRCTRWSNASGVLDAIAGVGTCLGAEETFRLAQLHLVAATGQGGTWAAAKPLVEPQLREIAQCRDYMAKWPNFQDWDDPDEHVTCMGITSGIDWKAPFRVSTARLGAPEIIYAGALRVQSAAYVYTDGWWRRVPR